MNGVVNVDGLRCEEAAAKDLLRFYRRRHRRRARADHNEQAFRQVRIVPCYLVDVSVRDQSATLFGRTYSSRIGIAPTGLADLFRRRVDLMLAQAASVPLIMSGTSSIEDLGKMAPDHGWYQLYSAMNPPISEDMIMRASDAGLNLGPSPSTCRKTRTASAISGTVKADVEDQARSCALSGLNDAVVAARHTLSAIGGGTPAPTPAPKR